MNSINVSILLVGADLSCTAPLLLSESNYNVTISDTGKEALDILLNRQHGFNLVMTDINLQDMHSFEFIRKVENQTRLPVVMICDSYDESTAAKGLMCGAILCLVKPVFHNDIKDLWQFPTFKQREVMLESHRFLMTRENVPSLHEGAQENALESGSQGNRKRKVDEFEKSDDWSIGELPSRSWTPYIMQKLLEVLEGLRISNPSSLVTECIINIPGLAATLVMKGLLKQRDSLRGPQNLLPPMPYFNESSAFPPNQSFMAGNSMGPWSNNNCKIIYKDSESCLRRYLENPHTCKQLKKIINGSMRKWTPFLSPMEPLVGPPSPPTIVLHDHLGVPPISVPIALAREIEKFIHITTAATYAPPGFMYGLASMVAFTGPSVVAELPEGDEELEPRYLEELDTDDFYDAIEELRD